jgi:Na+-driven multidrug efflux pump
VTRIKQMFLWPVSFVKDYFIKSTPLLINEMGYSVAVLVINIVFGRQGEANLAAVSIFRTLEGLLYSFFRGFANASSVMVGKRVGAGELKDATQQAVWFAALCPIWRRMCRL